MLFQANSPRTLWKEALLAVVFIYNCSPHSYLQYKTPYEARLNEKPSISNIKVWGSISHLKLPNPASKLDPKATSGILVGYGANQYKVFILSTGKLLFTRDITILEGGFLSSKQIKQSEPIGPIELTKKLINLEATSEANTPSRATSAIPSAITSSELEIELIKSA